MKLLILSLVVVLGVQSESEGFDYDIEDFSPLHRIDRVIICLTNDASQQIRPHRFKMFRLFPDMSIEFHDDEDCLDQIKSDKNGERTILAIIAAKPFKELASTEVPIYFYDAPYFLEELEAYPNAVPAVKDWRPLKHAFTHFFKQQDWIRVAIVSDDSPYSAAFEEELVGHLKDQQLVYNAQRCVHVSRFDKSCNFDEALRFIKESKALIVVANVDANSARELVRAAKEHGVTSTNQFVWLARDWPFTLEYKQKLCKLGPIFSLTLAPMLREPVSFLFHSHVSDGPYLVSVLQGLSLLKDAIRNTERERIDYFYRDIAKYMNTVIRSETHDTQAFIRKIDVKKINNCSTVITVVAVNDRFITGYSDFNDVGPKMYDVDDCNMMRSNVFTDPCNDFWIIAIVIVVLLSVLIFLFIIYVYNLFLSYFERELNKLKRN